MRKRINKDIDRVFFREFSEVINLSGVTLRAIKSYQKYEKKYRKGKSISVEEGKSTIFSNNGMSLSVKERDLPLPIKVGETIDVDGIEFTVLEKSEKNGVIEFYIERVLDV